MQRSVGNAAVVSLMREASDDPYGISAATASGGQPLNIEVRRQMETAFDTDFSSVRVHTGADANDSARSVGARAYTVGDDVVFSNGNFDPASDSGRHTLAHQLTHVLQQRSGPVDGTDTGNGVRVSDPSDPYERAAESTADQVMDGKLANGDAPHPVTPDDAHPGTQSDVSGPDVQRQGDEGEEDEMQMLVQREAEEPEELDEQA